MSLVIPIKINNTPVSAIIDTAAQVSVISEDFANTLEAPLITHSEISLKGAGKDNIIHARTVNPVEILIGSVKTNWPILLANISDPVILGLDFLKANNATIDLSKLCLTINDRRIQASMIKTRGGKAQVSRITLKHKIVVGPYEVIETTGVMEKEILDNIVLQPSHDLDGLLIPHSLVTAKDQQIPVMLRNPSPRYITLEQSHNLGVVTEIEEIIINSDPSYTVNSISTRDEHDTLVDKSTECDMPDHLQDLYDQSILGLSEKQALEIKYLLLNFQDIFAVNDFDLGLFKGIRHSVDTGDAKPIHAKLRRTPLGFEKEEEKHLAEMLEKGIIVHSQSEWASAPVLVRKKDGTVRYCIDFRGVNKLTRRDQHPLPNIETCLDTLAGANYISTLDMAASYWQVEVEPKDRHKLAFVTKFGLFEFARLPFGTSNSPATFQRIIQLVLQGLNWHECLAYLDDVVVVGKDFNSHMVNLKAVFARFRHHNLKLKPKKCYLFRRELVFLGKLANAHSKAHTCIHQKRCFSTHLQKIGIRDGLSGSRNLLCRRQANVLVYASAIDVRWNSPTATTPDIVIPHEVTSAVTPGSIGYIPDPPPIPEPVEIADVLNALGEPTLASVGLGGWSPPGLLQTYLDTLHVTCDLPWWGAIAVGTVIIRCIMFPLVIIAQRNAAQMNNHMPVVVRLQQKFTHARSSGNPIEAARAGQELMDYMKKHQVKPFKNFLVPLAQMPIFISVFVGLRRMANLPVESMKSGGMYWFTDLTVPDPIYILPVLTMASLFVTLELGVDGMKASSMAHVMKWVMRIMPIFIFPFISNFPAAMLCYWLTSNLFSLVQVFCLRIPKVRKYFKIPKMVTPDPATAAKKKGFMEGFREAMDNAKASQRIDERHRVDSLQFKDAGTGPLQKTYKYDPTKMQVPRTKPGISAKSKR